MHAVMSRDELMDHARQVIPMVVDHMADADAPGNQLAPWDPKANRRWYNWIGIGTAGIDAPEFQDLARAYLQRITTGIPWDDPNGASPLLAELSAAIGIGLQIRFFPIQLLALLKKWTDPLKWNQGWATDKHMLLCALCALSQTVMHAGSLKEARDRMQKRDGTVWWPQVPGSPIPMDRGHSGRCYLLDRALHLTPWDIHGMTAMLSRNVASEMNFTTGSTAEDMHGTWNPDQDRCEDGWFGHYWWMAEHMPHQMLVWATGWLRGTYARLGTTTVETDQATGGIARLNMIGAALAAWKKI